jgi:SAM-dependent methyltransferase
VNPQPSWEELEFYYNSGYEAYDPTHGSTGSDDEVIEQAKRAGTFRHIPLPTGLRILDVGCGGGWFLRICKKLGAIEQGVEPSEHAADMWQKQGLRVFNGTLEQYIDQEQNAKFDIITAHHVVEHLPDPVKTLDAMRRLLSPNGYIWIEVPNATNPICRALEGRWYSSDLPYHLMHFTPASMTEAGRRAGLKVRSQITESMPKNVAASIYLVLRYKCLLPIRLTKSCRFIFDPLSKWYAAKLDANFAGEALITEFVPTSL